MIGWLCGKIIDKQQPGKFVIDVNGVGYDVETSLTTFFTLESETNNIGLHIHTIVREDAFLLYGFIDIDERALFRALIKVNGIGPKVAIAILSSILPSEFIQCIHSQDTALLTKLPGIGKKTAERLVVEMKDSIKNLSYTLPKVAEVGMVNHADEAISALEALGFKRQEISKVIDKIADASKSSEQLIREALRKLSVH
ncbi:MAG: Holliday junction branch migration protein RuvA [Legionellaceae bacterium]|nr:Holliday junction branch migration protein RuvA [Legionellaceae bacterium]